MKISVEFAHTNLAAIDKEEMERSAQAMKCVGQYLREEGHDLRSVVLLDDKKVEREEAEQLAADLFHLLENLKCAPDNWYYERDLINHLPELSQALPKKQRHELERSTRSYIRDFDALPCSVDIALWHTLRLGLLGQDPIIDRSDAVISILGDGNQEYEALARRNVLDHLASGMVSSRVISLYYPEKSSASFWPEALLAPLATALKEMAPCPAS